MTHDLALTPAERASLMAKGRILAVVPARVTEEKSLSLWRGKYRAQRRRTKRQDFPAQQKPKPKA
jgi:hypothetical protein